MIAYKKQLSILCLFLCLLRSNLVHGLGQFNWLRPYDTLLRPDHKMSEGMQLNFYGEFGVKKATGYNVLGQPVCNVLQILSQTQDAIAMLDGFPTNSNIAILNDKINAVDDGTRGHLRFTGDLYMNWTFAITGRYFFGENLCLSAYLPFYGLSLKHVRWQDQTEDNSLEDLRVKEFLTTDIKTIVKQLGNLYLGDWKRNGAGDLVVWTEFFKTFPQTEQRPMLKEVDINGRFGFNIPTGLEQDENLLMAVPFGYDGAYGVFGGAGIDVLLSYIMKFGVDVELLHLFGNTRERRIKTADDQTELLLLQKVCAYRDWGLYQRYNLYAQLYNLLDCAASLKIGYQFFKHNADTLSFSSCDFSTNVANTATSLQEWTMHHIYLIAEYDASIKKDYLPYMAAYARIPFRGRNIALIPVIGANISFSF